MRIIEGTNIVQTNFPILETYLSEWTKSGTMVVVAQDPTFIKDACEKMVGLKEQIVFSLFYFQITLHITQTFTVFYVRLCRAICGWFVCGVTGGFFWWCLVSLWLVTCWCDWPDRSSLVFS